MKSYEKTIMVNFVGSLSNCIAFADYGIGGRS